MTAGRCIAMGVHHVHPWSVFSQGLVFRLVPGFILLQGCVCNWTPFFDAHKRLSRRIRVRSNMHSCDHVARPGCSWGASTLGEALSLCLGRAQGSWGEGNPSFRLVGSGFATSTLASGGRLASLASSTPSASTTWGGGSLRGNVTCPAIGGR